MKLLHWQTDVSTLQTKKHYPLESDTVTPPAIVFLQQAKGLYRSSSSTPPTKIPNFNERNEFLAFMKVLFRLLKINEEESRLQQAKKIVAECALRNRNGNANFALWKHSVDHRLRAVVGDTYWLQSQRYLIGYKYRRGLLGDSSDSA